ncbi:hypothetical protein EhV164_00228 [Emiliania huxleyi virus 164]|nr:hypothetical protein EhV164_00228 [Emiliania huxleyi virus 164]
MFSEYIINQISEHTKLATVTQIQLECLYASWKELGNVPTSMTPIGEIVNETDITTWKRVQIVKIKNYKREGLAQFTSCFNWKQVEGSLCI